MTRVCIVSLVFYLYSLAMINIKSFDGYRSFDIYVLCTLVFVRSIYVENVEISIYRYGILLLSFQFLTNLFSIYILVSPYFQKLSSTRPYN